MKKTKLLCTIALALTLGLVACGGGAKEEGGEQSGSGSATSSKHVHTFDTSRWESDDEYHWHPATCEHTTQKGDRAKHDFNNPTNVVAAKCEEDGSQDVVCKICGKQVHQILPHPGHQWVDVPQAEDTNYVAPGYGTVGKKTQKCENCPETQVVDIPALERGFTISNAEFQKKDDGKVYLRLSGTCDNYEVDNFKWAYALQDYNNGQGNGKFLAGKENPEAADFNLPVELTKGTGDEDDTFTVDFNLTDIVVPDGVDKPGRYNLWAGPQDNYKTINVSLKPGNYADNSHRYYFRNDQQVGSRLTVCIEELPPFFHFTDAIIDFKAAPTEEDPAATNAWVKIYGKALDQTKSVTELQAELDAAHTACRFQDSGYTTRNSAEQFRMEAYEDGGFKYIAVWVDVQFMVDGGNTVYNTHLNLKAGETINEWRDYTNCVMEEDFQHDYDIGNDMILRVFSHPLGENTQANSYGNLGFQKMAKPAETVEPSVE